MRKKKRTQKPNSPLVPLEFTKIIRSTNKAVEVTLKATGKPAQLPISRTLLYPGVGIAMVPAWLAQKILSHQSKKATQREMV